MPKDNVFERIKIMLAGNPAAYQMFQNGLMLWYAPNVIFAIAYEGKKITWWGKYTERWKDAGEPRYFGDAPDDCVIPQRGIGYIWSTRNLQPSLGYALIDETQFSGQYRSLDDDWVLDDWIGGIIELHSDVQPVPSPEPTGTGKWMWLTQLDLPVNLNHVAWVDADSLRLGVYDAVLKLPAATAAALRDYIKAQSVEIA